MSAVDITERVSLKILVRNPGPKERIDSPVVPIGRCSLERPTTQVSVASVEKIYRESCTPRRDPWDEVWATFHRARHVGGRLLR